MSYETCKYSLFIIVFSLNTISFRKSSNKPIQVCYNDFQFVYTFFGGTFLVGGFNNGLIFLKGAYGGLLLFYLRHYEESKKNNLWESWQRRLYEVSINLIKYKEIGCSLTKLHRN